MDSIPGRLKMVVLLALCLFMVPLLGWGTGWYMESEYDKQFRQLVAMMSHTQASKDSDPGKMGYLRFCSDRTASGGDAEPIAALCGPADEIALVRLASYATAAIGLLLFVLILGARVLAGTDPKRMSAVFGPMIRVVTLLLAVSVLAQGVLFVYSVYTLEVTAIQSVHAWLLLLVGVGALAACWALLKASIGVMKQQPLLLRACALDKSEQQGLHSFVEGIAAKLQSEKPDHIVVGLEPNFFVTASPLQLLGEDRVLQG